MEIQKFQKKPLVVEAVQVTADNFLAVANWCQGTIENNDGTPIEVGVSGGPTTQHIRVRVLNPMNERQTRAFIGDWVLYAGRGFKVYKDRAFNGSFVALTGEARDEYTQSLKDQVVPLNQ